MMMTMIDKRNFHHVHRTHLSISPEAPHTIALPYYLLNHNWFLYTFWSTAVSEEWALLVSAVWHDDADYLGASFHSITNWFSPRQCILLFGLVWMEWWRESDRWVHSFLSLHSPLLLWSTTYISAAAVLSLLSFLIPPPFLFLFPPFHLLSHN